MSTTRPNDDDGATTIRTGPASGFHSDFATSSMYIGDTLPEGLRLGEYEILSVIGEGGFGIVYLAYDHFLQRQVALKEYMPSSLAGRSRMGLDVTIRSERHRDTFMAGLRSFINEARLLAQFDHRALVKVYRFWEGNGTAYMVMPYVVGPTLKAALADMGTPPDEAWLRSQVLTPLMEALSLLHKASCLHRDIAPDNILLTETGPMLLDFGAARKVIGDLNQTLTVVLKPGYAPIEQYGEVPALTQGPWTDVYALGGVVRYAITGKVPVSATTRLVQDTMVPLTQLVRGHYGEAFLQAVDAALAIKPADRPQDMLEFSALLGETPEGGASPLGLVAIPPAPASAPVTTQAPVVRAPVAEVPVMPDVPEAQATAPVAAAAVPASSRSAMPWGLAVAALLALAVVAAWFMFRPVPGSALATGESPVAPSPAASAGRLAPVAPPVTAEPTPPAVDSQPQPSAPPPARVDTVSPAPTSSPVATPAPKAATPAPSERPVAPEPVAEKPVTDKPAAVMPPAARPAAGPDKSARCADLLQKASLEPLTASETSFLRTECK